jgi:SAM-dependent methyltransferase
VGSQRDDKGAGRDHVSRNRDAWNEWAPEFVEPGEAAWDAAEPYWGIWRVPEETLHMLPDEIAGLDAVELGCGTAYVSAWLAQRGARPVGVDVSIEQLATARRLQQEFKVDFPLYEVSAEELPFPDASFDLAISEYGASLWADPYIWVPEAARVLRPGGRLIFLTNGVILALCMGETEDELPGAVLRRDYFGLHRVAWPDDPSVEFHLGHGDWVRLLRANGFDLEDLIEVQPAEGATTQFGHVARLDWARRWPSEEIWKARKRVGP